MKTLLICAVLLGSAVVASAQGVIHFNNYLGTALDAPVYGLIPSDTTLSLRGNTINGKPLAGIVDYLGAPLLDGAAYWAELWVLDTGVFELVDDPATPAIVESRTEFRDGAAVGYVEPKDVVVPGMGDGAVATFQVRAWANLTLSPEDDVETWAEAVARGVPHGSSANFTATLRVAPSPPDNMLNLTSFNIAVPEPEAIAVISCLGLLAVVLGRRAFQGTWRHGKTGAP
jgi:hypothetical protein